MPWLDFFRIYTHTYFGMTEIRYVSRDRFFFSWATQTWNSIALRVFRDLSLTLSLFLYFIEDCTITNGGCGPRRVSLSYASLHRCRRKIHSCTPVPQKTHLAHTIHVSSLIQGVPNLFVVFGCVQVRFKITRLALFWIHLFNSDRMPEYSSTK